MPFALPTYYLAAPEAGALGLSDHMLRDIGLSRHELVRFARKGKGRGQAPAIATRFKGTLLMVSKTLWLIAAGLIVLGGMAYAATRSTPPVDLDYNLTQFSEFGQYRVTLAPSIDPVPVGQMHGWLVDVRAADGEAVEAEVRFDGGMPQHGHGLPTVPAVVGKDLHGRHIVGGVRFNMPGWWVLTVEVDGAAGTDTATFNLAL